MSKKVLILFFMAICAYSAYEIIPNEWPPAARPTAAIAVVAAFLWAFEIIPLYATSLLIVLLLTFFLGGSESPTKFPFFLTQFASPVVILFLGSFLIAAAMRKHGVDTLLAQYLFSEKGQKPFSLLLRLAFSTVILSMWISNTVTTAIVLGVMLGVIENLKGEEKFSRALILTIPFSANLGGIGTPVGSPPNAITLGLLRQSGNNVNFIEWMAICVPLLLILVPLNSFILYLMHRPNNPHQLIYITKSAPLTAQGKSVLFLTALCGILFLTTPLHQIPESVIALGIGTLLMIMGLINEIDIRSLYWDVLFLLWGGLSLGTAVEVSGLGQEILKLPLFSGSGQTIALALALFTLVLSFFISNTAAVSLILPLALTVKGADTVVLGIMLTITASLGMLLPISTPPNMIAFSTGRISSGNLIRSAAVYIAISFLIVIGGYNVVIPFVLRWI